MNEYIDTKYDHKLLLFSEDLINKKIAEALPDNDWIAWMSNNTTAENIARSIYIDLKSVLGTNFPNTVFIDKVTVYETPKNAASYKEEK